MDLVLKRILYSQNGIFGIIQDTRGDFLFTTLERSYPKDDGFHVKVQVGTYTCQLDFRIIKSIPEGFWTYEVKDVPNAKGILFHVGNYNRDSDGCILIGTGWGYDAVTGERKMITASRQAFAQFMQLQNKVETFTLKVENYF